MTENEAIGYFKMATDEVGNEEFSDVYKEMCKKAIQALEEIQQYRAIGTVEEITKLIKFLSFDDDTSILEDLQMLVEYYAIGTVEEFKALKEKSVAKKVQYDECGKEEGYPYCECGKCLIDDFVGVSYCPDCGQKLDWQ